MNNKFFLSATLLSNTVFGAPAASQTTAAPTVAAGATTATWSGNPFSDVSLWANKFYAAEISASAIPNLSGPKATAAAAVAKVPSFLWL